MSGMFEHRTLMAMRSYFAAPFYGDGKLGVEKWEAFMYYHPDFGFFAVRASVLTNSEKSTDKLISSIYEFLKSEYTAVNGEEFLDGLITAAKKLKDRPGILEGILHNTEGYRAGGRTRRDAAGVLRLMVRAFPPHKTIELSEIYGGQLDGGFFVCTIEIEASEYEILSEVVDGLESVLAKNSKKYVNGAKFAEFYGDWIKRSMETYVKLKEYDEDMAMDLSMLEGGEGR